METTVFYFVLHENHLNVRFVPLYVIICAILCKSLSFSTCIILEVFFLHVLPLKMISLGTQNPYKLASQKHTKT